jgi:hypothetical protein
MRLRVAIFQQTLTQTVQKELRSILHLKRCQGSFHQIDLAT